jgi:hypothetical protein
MKVEERIKALSTLGVFLRGLQHDEFQSIAEKASMENPWFTKENVRMAIEGIGRFLEEEILTAWIVPYKLPETSRKVALVMAGNIPLVGFHDRSRLSGSLLPETARSLPLPYERSLW